MQPGLENMVVVRQEILDLLRQQIEFLDSPLGLTDAQLRECYVRQTRVQELREQLQAAADYGRDAGAGLGTAEVFNASVA
jgi:hypothetical protein